MPEITLFSKYNIGNIVLFRDHYDICRGTIVDCEFNHKTWNWEYEIVTKNNFRVKVEEKEIIGEWQ